MTLRYRNVVTISTTELNPMDTLQPISTLLDNRATWVEEHQSLYATFESDGEPVTDVAAMLSEQHPRITFNVWFAETTETGPAGRAVYNNGYCIDEEDLDPGVVLG